MNKLNFIILYFISAIISLTIILLINSKDLSWTERMNKKRIEAQEISKITKNKNLLIFNNEYYIHMIEKYNTKCNIKQTIIIKKYIIIKQKCNY